MKTLSILLALLFSVPVYSANVYEAHDKFPKRYHSHENECNEHHNLQPDGDHDCDDPGTRGIPEPATLGLLALGLGGLMLRRRR